MVEVSPRLTLPLPHSHQELAVGGDLPIRARAPDRLRGPRTQSSCRCTSGATATTVAIYQDCGVKVSICNNTLATLREGPDSFVEALRLDRGKWYRATITIHPEKKVAMASVAGVTIIAAEASPEGSRRSCQQGRGT